jgi:ABC-type amino acid transport substrate-binding protein
MKHDPDDPRHSRVRGHPTRAATLACGPGRALALLAAATLGLATAWNAVAAGPPASRLDRIRADKAVRVCIWPDYYGITYRNPKTLELSGIDIDMARELGRELGVEVRHVDSSFARLVDDLTQDRCDVAMFAIGITPQRAEKLRFTEPHLASDIYAITSRSNRRIKGWEDIDKPGVVVAVAKGTLHEPVMKDKLKAAQLVVLDTPFAREQEVESGRADVFMTDFPYSQRFLANADWARRVAPPGPYHVTPYGWAMKPGDDAWASRVERFMSDVKRDGRLLEAARRHRLDPIVAP